MERRVAINVGSERVSGLLFQPDDAKALFVFAHGAGVGMNHPSMASTADGLAARGIATLRFNFPFMEKRTGRPGQSTDAIGAPHPRGKARSD